MVAKSFAPPGTPGSPQEINLSQWSAPPASSAMVAFGALSAANGRLVVYGWLDDTSNTANPQVLGKQYNEAASEDMSRTIAHRFADEIIARLGGGINGIAETKIYFISSRTGSKEVWVMDYDGANEHAVTHLGATALSPRVSPDGSRIAFASLDRHHPAGLEWYRRIGDRHALAPDPLSRGRHTEVAIAPLIDAAARPESRFVNRIRDRTPRANRTSALAGGRTRRTASA